MVSIDNDTGAGVGEATNVGAVNRCRAASSGCPMLAEGSTVPQAGADRTNGAPMDEQRYREAERALWKFVGLEPAERRVDLPCSGGKIRVQVVGDGEPALFIHGGPNSGSTWAPVLPYLTGLRCYIVDRPGTGLSDPFVLRDDIHGFAARFGAEVLDALDLQHAHLVASSFGGFLALMSAAKTPQRFDRMVQMACPAFVPGMKTPLFMKAIGVPPLRWLMNTLPPNERVGKQVLTQIGHGKSIKAGKIPKPFFDWYLALQRDTDTMRNDSAMIAGAITRKGVRPELTIPDSVFSSVTAPTLFLWGEDDTFGGKAEAEHVVRVMPHAELVMLADSGHLPWIDDPKLVGERTLEFLATKNAP